MNFAKKPIDQSFTDEELANVLRQPQAGDRFRRRYGSRPPACDGFVLAISSMPGGAYHEVVRLLVPELQRRDCFQKEYPGPTLRGNLGLPIPRRYLAHSAPAAFRMKRSHCCLGARGVAPQL